MRERHITLLELALIGATRGMIGFGAGLLAARHIERRPRTIVACSLLTIGLVSTIPLAVRVFRRGDRRVPARAPDLATKAPPPAVDQSQYAE